MSPLRVLIVKWDIILSIHLGHWISSPFSIHYHYSLTGSQQRARMCVCVYLRMNAYSLGLFSECCSNLTIIIYVFLMQNQIIVVKLV